MDNLQTWSSHITETLKTLEKSVSSNKDSCKTNEVTVANNTLLIKEHHPQKKNYCTQKRKMASHQIPVKNQRVVVTLTDDIHGGKDSGPSDTLP